MRIANSIDLPGEVERARIAGELVIFAGAGVSVDAPSSLPTFAELAREIAEPSLQILPDDLEQLDRYLGRAERLKNVDVQTRAREALTKRPSAHNNLHRDLLGLFPSAGVVRLVTTNFDAHFSGAFVEVFGEARYRHYVGPALPPGNEFRGIAQIHGSLDNTQDRLVLTNREFAAAYMTDGWAARFLVGVLAQRTVLFVGYSLTDPVMRYVLSALVPTRRWYALTHTDEAKRWSDHDVCLVTFDTRQDGDRFGDLRDGIHRWSVYARTSAIDHDRELRRLVSHGPPTSPLENDYVRVRLETRVGRATFFQTATTERWFDWAADAGMLAVLFDKAAEPRLVDEWSHWVTQHFLAGEAPPLLRFLRRTSFQLNSGFGLAIASHLARDPNVTRPVLSRLVALLVSQPAVWPTGTDYFDLLLATCIKRDAERELVAVLRWMTQLRLEPLEHFFLRAEEDYDDTTDADRPIANRVRFNADTADLNYVLNQYGAHAVSVASDSVASLGVSRIQELYELLELARGKESAFDWPSYGRTAIAPSNQDQSTNVEDILVILVRTVLEHWRKNRPRRVLEFGRQHSRSRRGLLRRLSLYAFSLADSAPPLALLRRAARENWASDIWIRPEFYRFLRTHYSRATEAARATFIGSIPKPSESESTESHARFSLSQHLLGIAPDSPATREFAATESAKHPTWKQQDPEGFLSRVQVGWAGEEPSPLAAEQLRGLNPSEALVRVSAELEQHEEHHAASAILGALQQAFANGGKWATDGLVAVTTPGHPSQLIAAALSGLRDAHLNAPDALTALQGLLAWEWPDDVIEEVSGVLYHWARRPDLDQSVELLAILDRLADRVFERARLVSVESEHEGEWADYALLSPGGQAAATWWMTANRRNSRADGFVLSVSAGELERWEKVLEDDTGASAYARSVLGMASDRLSNGDYPWCERKLFPSFDVERKSLRAAQLWDGRLVEQRWSWTTITGLRPYMLGFFRESRQLVPRRGRQLGDWVALLAAHPEHTQFNIEDLRAFVAGSAIDARLAFARSIPRQLAELTPGRRINIWTTLLSSYWFDRITNVPAALSSEEVVAMIDWMPAISECATQVLEALERGPGLHLEHANHIILEWRDGHEWPAQHPEAAVRLIFWLATRESIPAWSREDAVHILERAFEAGAPKERVLAAANSLAELGSSAAVEFADRIR